MPLITERPIMFSAAMVKAILDGRKTQTRRIVKVRADSIELLDGFRNEWSPWRDGERQASILCPYGVPGDRLWLREALRFRASGLTYAADGVPVLNIPDDAKPFQREQRPSMLMPRWASRITLEITDVREQRLQEISDEDAKAEGIQHDGVERVYHVNGQHGPCHNARDAFACLWDSINAKRAPWASNPYVWAVTFKRV